MVPASTYERTMNQVEELVATLVDDGQVITHLDVCVTTRSVTDTTKGDFRRFPAPGADPLMSTALLLVLLDELRVRLNPNINLKHMGD
jgi:hypothetical protein